MSNSGMNMVEKYLSLRLFKEARLAFLRSWFDMKVPRPLPLNRGVPGILKLREK